MTDIRNHTAWKCKQTQVPFHSTSQQPFPPPKHRKKKNTIRSGHRHRIPLRKLHLQRALLPDDDDPALVEPALLARGKLVVEAEQEPRDDDPQLRVGQVLAQAVSGAETEGVCFFFIVLFAES